MGSSYCTGPVCEAPEDFLELNLKEALVYEIHYSNLSDDWNVYWRAFLNRKVATSPVWRTFWNMFEDAWEEPVDYKEICIIIDDKCKELDDNWRSGELKMAKIRLKGPSQLLFMDEDYIVNVPEAKDLDFNFQLLERSALAEEWRGCLLGKDDDNWNIDHAAIYKNLIIFSGKGMMRLVNSDEQQEASHVKEPRGWAIDHLCISSTGFLATISADVEKNVARDLIAWQVTSSNEVTLLKEWSFDGEIVGLHVDDNWMAVLVLLTGRRRAKGVQLNFISTKSLAIERSMCLPLKDKSDVAYGDGLMIFIELTGSIRVMDVSSGMFMPKMKCKPWRNISDIKVNSKFVITAESFVAGTNTEFRIYDRKMDGGVADILVTSFQVPNFKLTRMLLSETRLVCYGNVQKRVRQVEDATMIVQMDFAADLLTLGQDFFSAMRNAFSKLRKIIPVKCKEFPLEEK